MHDMQSASSVVAAVMPHAHKCGETLSNATPAISLLVSTMSTASPRPPCCGGVLMMRAMSRRRVVLPVPGLPSTNRDCALQEESNIISNYRAQFSKRGKGTVRLVLLVLSITTGQP
jgi:hypothetical protein